MEAWKTSPCRARRRSPGLLWRDLLPVRYPTPSPTQRWLGGTRRTRVPRSLICRSNQPDCCSSRRCVAPRPAPRAPPRAALRVATPAPPDPRAWPRADRARRAARAARCRSVAAETPAVELDGVERRTAHGSVTREGAHDRRATAVESRGVACKPRSQPDGYRSMTTASWSARRADGVPWDPVLGLQRVRADRRRSAGFHHAEARRGALLVAGHAHRSAPSTARHAGSPPPCWSTPAYLAGTAAAPRHRRRPRHPPPPADSPRRRRRAPRHTSLSEQRRLPRWPAALFVGGDVAEDGLRDAGHDRVAEVVPADEGPRSRSNTRARPLEVPLKKPLRSGPQPASTPLYCPEARQSASVGAASQAIARFAETSRELGQVRTPPSHAQASASAAPWPPAPRAPAAMPGTPPLDAPAAAAIPPASTPSPPLPPAPDWPAAAPPVGFAAGARAPSGRSPASARFATGAPGTNARALAGRRSPVIDHGAPRITGGSLGRR